MKVTFILIAICTASMLLATVSVKGMIKAKKELKAEKKKEKENAKIDKETIENIDAVTGGDIHAGNDILHQLAEKRK